MQAIKVAIIDDHEVVLNGLKAMLSNHEEINVVFTTTQTDVLMTFLKEYGADVVLMDIQMPDISGIDLCKMIRKEHADTQVIAFSSFDDTHYIKQVLRNGALGYVLKNADQHSIKAAIQTVAEGEEYIDESVKKILIHESITGQRRSIYEIPLTKREKEILKLIAEENTNQQVADALFISLRTVETHRLNISQKLGVKNTAGLVKEAIKRGLI